MVRQPPEMSSTRNSTRVAACSAAFLYLTCSATPASSSTAPPTGGVTAPSVVPTTTLPVETATTKIDIGGTSTIPSRKPAADAAVVPTVDAQALLRQLEKDIEEIDQRKEQLKNESEAEPDYTTSTRAPSYEMPTLELGTLGPTLGDFPEFDLYGSTSSGGGGAEDGEGGDSVLEEEKLATMSEQELILYGVKKNVPFRGSPSDKSSPQPALYCRDHIVALFHAYVLQKFEGSKMRFLRHGFSHFDLNKDGTLSELEMAQFLKSRKSLLHKTCNKPNIFFHYVKKQNRVKDYFKFEYVEPTELYVENVFYYGYVVPFVDLAVFVGEASYFWSLYWSKKLEDSAIEFYDQSVSNFHLLVKKSEFWFRTFVKDLFFDEKFYLKLLLQDYFSTKESATSPANKIRGGGVEGSKTNVVMKNGHEMAKLWIQKHLNLDVTSREYFLQVKKEEEILQKKQEQEEIKRKLAEEQVKEMEREARAAKEKAEKERAELCENSFIKGENGEILPNTACHEFQFPSDAVEVAESIATGSATSINSTAGGSTTAASTGENSNSTATASSERKTEASSSSTQQLQQDQIIPVELDVHAKRAEGFLDTDFAKYDKDPSAVDGISQLEWFYFLFTEPYSLQALFYTTTMDKVLVYSSILVPTFLFFSFLAG
ncbi:unnamed protein product [Amoebophrya sp. A120]|nr:unnamed protein product [Amoebophrya sp. A120]|eukprot:GSA120T00007413001.1